MKMTALVTAALLLAGVASTPAAAARAATPPGKPRCSVAGSIRARRTRRPRQPAFAGQTRAPERKTNVAFDVVTVAEGLDKPWGLTFLPGGKMLVTEKPRPPARRRRDGTLSPAVAGPAAGGRARPGRPARRALDPPFAQNQLIYWSYSEPRDRLNNTAVARGKFVDGAEPRVENVQVIYHQAPS